MEPCSAREKVTKGSITFVLWSYSDRKAVHDGIALKRAATLARCSLCALELRVVTLLNHP
jgi:hypothetical protein